MREDHPGRKGAGKSRIRVFFALHVLLFVYSLSGLFSKSASSQTFLSLPFILLYGGMLFILFVYALGWQQIIKRLPLTVAYANKAITVVWGIVWGCLLFGESVSLTSLIGAGLVIAGVVLFAVADGQDRASEEFERG